MVKGEEKKQVKLQVTAELLQPERTNKLPQGVAYAYSKGGRLLDQAELDKKGHATLVFPASDQATAVRVLVGAAVKDKATKISELQRRGAEGRMIRIDPSDLNPRVNFTIFPEKWLCWLLSICFVPGTLFKREEVDGTSIDLPVCGAEVEVYEVDPLPLIIARLPDSIIDKIRKYVIEPIPEPPFEHLPPERKVPKGPFPPPPPPPVQSLEASTFASPEDTSADLGVQKAVSVSSDLITAARTASIYQFRDVLLKYQDFTRFFLCRFYPFGLTMDLVVTATTDECGKFRAAFFRGCKNPDTPDLYFKAKQQFGPFTFTIYEPTPVSCYTRWNYTCGTEVNLYTSSVFAITCSPCPPIEPPEPGMNWVAVMHIGNTPLSRIRGTSANAGIQGSDNATNKGMLFANVNEANNAVSFNGRPLGGMLRPHIEFDNSLREDLGVKYYQVSWRRAGTTDAFQLLTGEVHRHYSHEPPGATTPVFEVYPLGPVEVGGKTLFEIPPAMPPKGKWVVTDLVENNTSAKFPTHSLIPVSADGKYELKIELFDSAGNLINIDTLNIIYVVPEQLNIAADAPVTTVNAADLGLVVDEDSDGNKSFIMTVHVDNHSCEADIDKAQLTAPANDCGVILYDSGNTSATVTMPYTASHPNDFATRLFRLKRGVTNLPPFSQGGSSPLVSANLAPGSTSQTATVAELTQAYPAYGLAACSIAAFSEDLHVWAMAHNGWRRLYEYDDNDHAAFVLAPEEE